MSKRVLEVVIKVQDQASRGFDKFTGKVGAAKKSLANLSVGAIAAAAAVVLAVKKMVSSLGDLVTGVAEAGDEIDKMAMRTGESADELARWVFISKLAGGSASTVEVTFKKLSKSMFDAQQGLSTAVRAFEKLGVEVKKANGELRPANEVLLDLADAFEKSTNRTETMAVAQDVLGRGALQMVAILEQGRDTLSSQATEYDRLHGSISRTADAGAEWVDATLRMETAMQGLKEEAVVPLIETLTPMVNKLSRNVGAITNWTDAAKVAGFYLGILTEDVLDFALATEKYISLVDQFTPPDMFGGEEARAKALAAALAKIADSPVLQKDFGVAAFEGLIDQYGLLGEAEAERADQLLTTAEAEALRNEEQLAGLTAAGEAADMHIKQLEDMQSAEEDLADAVADVAANFERLAADSISAMLLGTDGAIMFGRMLRTVVINALSAVIAKMLVLKALNAFSGGILSIFGIKDGGSIPEFAAGGSIPHAAAGYAVPDGPRGRDSRLIAAMPGEEVISRSLSQRLAGFLAAQDSAAMVSPGQLAGGAGGGVSVALNVGRPVGWLDILDLGEAATMAARKVAEANL